MQFLLLLRPRMPFVGIALAAVAGILLGELSPQPAGWLVAGAFLLGVVTFALPNRWLCLLFVAAAFCALHAVRHLNSAARSVELQLGNQQLPVAATGVVWSEPSSSVSSRGQPRATFWMKVRELRIEENPVPYRGLCLVRWAGAAPAYGDAVKLDGTVRPIAEVTNPGQFDTAGWLRRNGIRFEVVARSTSDCRTIGEGQASTAITAAISARKWIQSKLELGLGDSSEVTLLIESMVLGFRGETPPEMKGLFQKTGTLHLFAVSGLNVAMLAGIVWLVLKPLRFSRRAAAFVIIPVLCAYAVVTGLSPSCVRATIMAAFVLGAQFVERSPVPVNSLAAAAVAILAWDTNELFAPGFQLSFVLVLFIMLLTSPIARRVERFGQPDDFIPVELWTRRQKWVVAVWSRIGVATGVTLSAWIGSLIFMAGYFHLVSPVAILANSVAVPLAFCVLALGLMSLVCAAFSSAVAALVNQANWAVAEALLASLALLAKVPGGYIYVENPRLESVPACEVTALEVGEGAALHVRAGKGDWLVDCGGARDYETSLLPYLRSRGVNKLDGLFLSHGDSAHIGGALPLISDFHPRWIADTAFMDRSPARREVHAAVAEAGIGRRYVQRGDEVALGENGKLVVLYPPTGIERRVSDDKALVCRVESTGRRILFVSDAGFVTENWLLEHEPDLRADALIMGWHSKDISGTPDFLTRVRPAAVVVSARSFGTSSSRSEQLARECGAIGAEVFNQDSCGAVRIEIRGDGELVIRSFLGGQILRSRAR